MSYLEGADAGTGYSATELADLILEQNNISGADAAGAATTNSTEAASAASQDKPKPNKKVGSVIVADYGESVYGFMSVIDMQRFRVWKPYGWLKRWDWLTFWPPDPPERKVNRQIRSFKGPFVSKGRMD